MLPGRRNLLVLEGDDCGASAEMTMRHRFCAPKEVIDPDRSAYTIEGGV